MVNATVVVADRLGLRCELSTASLPGTPNNRRGSHPANALNGLTSTGPRISTARKVSAPPSMTTYSALSPGPVLTPYAVAPPPASRNNPAKTPRSTPVRNVCSSTCERSAAIGATRVAARAGSSAAATVISTPSTMPTATVRGASATPPEGTSIPVRPSTASAPAPRPRPASRPSTDAIRPTTADSSRTEPNTCLRVAPMQRSSAISRVRCATRMLNVL
ncbi:hypothetical protein GCM10018955_42100 [Planomonospora venezuelensis]